MKYRGDLWTTSFVFGSAFLRFLIIKVFVDYNDRFWRAGQGPLPVWALHNFDDPLSPLLPPLRPGTKQVRFVQGCGLDKP